MALDLTSPFVWGAGGSRLTPEEIAAQRKVADSLLASGMDYSPIKSPWQGAARVAQAVLGGLESGEAGAASKANAAESGKLIAALLGGGAAPAAATDAASAPIATGAAVPAGNTTIPAGSIDPALSSAISTAASSNGVDPAYMTRLALVENGGKINGSSPLSSATGPFQFLNSTAKQYGLTNPSDPAAAADAAARLTLDNKAALTQALGREPTLGELYLAHQQGAGGAAKLLANPDAPVEQVIGHTAAANNGASPGMTAGQFASKWTNKFADLGQPQVVDANQSSPLDTAQYPAGPVGSPTAIAGNASGVPPVMTGDQSSPLDTAMYPAGPVGAPMMAASGGAPQAADGVDPAALPVNAQPTQGTVPTAQAVQAATASAPSAKPAINPAILQAMTSPYVDPQTKAIATMLFKSQMDQQAKANDPMRALQMEKLRADIAKAQGKAGTTEYGLNPIYGTDANGNAVLGTMGKDGTFKQVDTNGVKISTGVDKIDLGTQFAIYDKKSGNLIGYQPKDVAGEAAAKKGGTLSAERQAALPQARAGLSSSLNSLDRLKSEAAAIKDDSALASITGWQGVFPNMPGGKAADVQARLQTLKSQVGFSVLQAMRDASKTGGALGSVSDAEGVRLENNLAALDRAQSMEAFQSALGRIVQYVDDAKGRLSRSFTETYPGQDMSTGSKRLKFNPATGALE